MSFFTLVRSFLISYINEYRSSESLRRLQEKKFRKLLKYAYNNSRFYRNLYIDAGIREQDISTISIEDIPSIDKEQLMDHFDDVITVDNVIKHDVLDFLESSKNPNDLFKNKYHIIHTSGSSGKLGIFVYNQKEWDMFLPYITKAFGFRFAKKRASFLGAAGGHFTGVSFSAWMDKGFTRFFSKPLILDINESVNNIVKKLNEFQPDILGGYFNGLKVLAGQQKNGQLHIHPHSIVNCGEGIIPKDKQYIESVFNSSMANLYGFAECIIVGVGRREYGGIALFDDIALIEIKEDHILLTNLINKTLPIIRYRIDDYLKQKSSRGLKIPYTIIDDIIGRAEFIIWFENSDGEMDFIHPLIFTDFYVKGLDKLQFVIKNKKSFDFLAVITSKNKEEVVNKIKEKLDQLLAKKNFTNVTYKIKIVNTLSIDKKTGKFKLILKKEKQVL